MSRKERCVAKKMSNKRCKNNATFGFFCKTHASKELLEQTPLWKSREFKLLILGIAVTTIISIITTLITPEKKQIPSNDQSINIEHSGSGNNNIKVSQQTGYGDKQLSELKTFIASMKEEEKLTTEAINLFNSGHKIKAREVLSNLMQKQQIELSGTLYRLGLTSNYLGDYYDAQKHFEQALQNNPKNLRLLQVAGLINDTVGLYQESISLSTKLLEAAIKVSGHESENTYQARYSLGNAFARINDYEKALEQYEIALSGERKLFKNSPSKLALGIMFVGHAYSALGENEKGINYIKESLQTMSKNLPTNHTYIISAYNNLAAAYAWNQEYEKAEKQIKLAISKSLHNPNFDKATTLKMQSNLYRFLIFGNKYNEAIPIAEKVIADSKAMFRTPYVQQRDDYSMLALAYFRTNRFNEAKSHFTLALNSPKNASNFTNSTLLKYLAIVEEKMNDIASHLLSGKSAH